MKGDAIRAVGEAIEQRLELVLGAGKVFLGPPDGEGAGTGSVILFPYRVAANADHRNTERRLAAADPALAEEDIFDNAVPLDLYFLLCAGPAKAPDKWEGFTNLGRAIQALQEPANIGVSVQNEIVHLSMDTTTTEEMGRIWALFPAVNYRTSVVYLATPVWIDPPLPRLHGAPVVGEQYAVNPAVEQEEPA